jgi:hypothetical protein
MGQVLFMIQLEHMLDGGTVSRDMVLFITGGYCLADPVGVLFMGPGTAHNRVGRTSNFTYIV